MKENQAKKQEPWPNERFTFISVIVDERTEKRKSLFSNVQKDVNEVRYMLKDEKNKQKVLKIG